MLVKEFLFHSTCKVRHGNLLKMCVSEIHVKQIRVNQGLGVFLSVLAKTINQKISDQNVCGFSSKLNGLNPGKWEKV